MFKSTVLGAMAVGLAVSTHAALLEVGDGYTYETIQSAVSAATAGDVVRVHAGNYNESVSFSSSGTEGNYLTLEAADGEDVVVDGAVALTGWTQCASADDCGGNPNWEHIWYTTTSTMVPVLNCNVFEGDELLSLGQYPFPADPFWDRQASEFISVPTSGYSESTISDPTVFTETEDDYWNGALVYVYAPSNRVYGRTINDYDGGTHTITYSSVPDGINASRDKYAVANHLSLMDRAGTFTYIQMEKRIFLWPKDTASLEDGSIRMSVKSRAIYVSGKPYVRISGLTFKQYINTAIYARASSDGLVVEDCEFFRFMSDGRADAVIVNNSSDCFIYGNSIHDNRNGSGMTFNGGTGNIVADNVLRNNGATGITFYEQDGSMLLNNEVYDHVGVHANGLTVYESNVDVTVAGNRVFDGNNALTYQMVTGMTVRNNILHSANAWVVACWTASNSVNCSFYHNLLLNAGGNGFYSQAGDQTNLVLKNNIITGTFGYTATRTHNIYTGSQSSLNTGELVVSDLTELFTDYAGRDYTLKAGCAAVDAGTDVGVEDDIESLGRPAGSAPDIGPHEYGGVLGLHGDGVSETNPSFRVPNPLHYGAVAELRRAGCGLELFALDGTPLAAEQLTDGRMILVRHEGGWQQVTVVK